MAVQSSTLLSMITLAGRGISKPTDLAGRTLGGAMTRTVRYAVDNSDEAGTLVQGKLPTVKGALVAKTTGLMKPYVTSPALDRDRVTRGIAVLAAAGLAASSLSPDAAIDFGAAAKAG